MTIRTAAFVLLPALALTACGNYEDASVEAQADTVEIPANEPLTNVTAVPVADPNANTDVPVDEPPVEGGVDATGAPAAGTPATGAPAATPATPAASPTPAVSPQSTTPQ
ncbi:hypothetical protein [Porphyrobacter sp. GA68]|uniref:hypothetical protein n=1 Tax=Porphyrobacter sp. GA68 TaxID=2883480 RepID=UPI001D18A0F3|nr:hypothetical protein [Porphyrobacter sp. GA68]